MYEVKRFIGRDFEDETVKADLPNTSDNVEEKSSKGDNIEEVGKI